MSTALSTTCEGTADSGRLKQKLRRVGDLLATALRGGLTEQERELETGQAAWLQSYETAAAEARNLDQALATCTHERNGQRQHYLDLMQACLVGTIYNDAPLASSGLKSFDAQLREFGWDWPSVAHSMIGTRRMQNLRTECERVLRENVPGDFIETGVWRGGACIMMRAVLKAYGDTERRVWVCDSFAGLPPPDTRYGADAQSNFHEFNDLAVSDDVVRGNFEKYGLLDDQVRFVKGFFKDTLPTAPIERLAVLRLDGDMYESTMDALTALYDKLSPGGTCIIDDYRVVDACKQAVEEFRASRSISEPIVEIDGVGVYWIKLR